MGERVNDEEEAGGVEGGDEDRMGDDAGFEETFPIGSGGLSVERLQE